MHPCKHNDEGHAILMPKITEMAMLLNKDNKKVKKERNQLDKWWKLFVITRLLLSYISE